MNTIYFNLRSMHIGKAEVLPPVEPTEKDKKHTGSDDPSMDRFEFSSRIRAQQPQTSYTPRGTFSTPEEEPAIIKLDA